MVCDDKTTDEQDDVWGRERERERERPSAAREAIRDTKENGRAAKMTVSRCLIVQRINSCFRVMKKGPWEEGAPVFRDRVLPYDLISLLNNERRNRLQQNDNIDRPCIQALMAVVVVFNYRDNRGNALQPLKWRCNGPIHRWSLGQPTNPLYKGGTNTLLAGCCKHATQEGFFLSPHKHECSYHKEPRLSYISKLNMPRVRLLSSFYLTDVSKITCLVKPPFS